MQKYKLQYMLSKLCGGIGEDELNGFVFTIVISSIILSTVLFLTCAIEGEAAGSVFDFALNEAHGGHFYSSPPLSSTACQLSLQMLAAANLAVRLEHPSVRNKYHCDNGTVITVVGFGGERISAR